MMPLKTQASINRGSSVIYAKPEKLYPSIEEQNTMSPRPNTWTYEQNKQYILFLKENKREFEDQQSRRFSKIYLEMSLNMKNKTPEQCRTHHKKALNKYKSIDGILNKLLTDTWQKIEKKIMSTTQLVYSTQSYQIHSGYRNNLTVNLKFDNIGEF